MNPTRLSRFEKGIRTVIDFNDAFNHHDVEGMMKFMSEDCVFEDTFPAPDGTRYEGQLAVTGYWQAFFQNSPHAHIEIEEIFGFGNHCIMRWTYSWQDASSGQGHVRGVDLFKIKNGLIAEKLSYVKG